MQSDSTDRASAKQILQLTQKPRYGNFCKTCLLVPYKKKILQKNLLYTKQFLVSIANIFVAYQNFLKIFPILLDALVPTFVPFYSQVSVFLNLSEGISVRIFWTENLTSASVANLTPHRAFFRRWNSRKSHDARSGL